jgi:hypothetical protein
MVKEEKRRTGEREGWRRAKAGKGGQRRVEAVGEAIGWCEFISSTEQNTKVSGGLEILHIIG